MGSMGFYGRNHEAYFDNYMINTIRTEISQIVHPLLGGRAAAQETHRYYVKLLSNQKSLKSIWNTILMYAGCYVGGRGARSTLCVKGAHVILDLRQFCVNALPCDSLKCSSLAKRKTTDKI
jgi:hypothetical protein